MSLAIFFCRVQFDKLENTDYKGPHIKGDITRLERKIAVETSQKSLASKEFSMIYDLREVLLSNLNRHLLSRVVKSTSPPALLWKRDHVMMVRMVDHFDFSVQRPVSRRTR